MKRVTQIVEFDRCPDCPHFNRAMGFPGDYKNVVPAYCKKSGRDIEAKDMVDGFPSWCPIEDVKE